MLVESMFFQEQQKSAYIKKEGKTERKNIDLLARPTHGVGLKHKFTNNSSQPANAHIGINRNTVSIEQTHKSNNN